MKKKKIALICDADDWCYANIARTIAFNLKYKYDFDIIPSQYLDDSLGKILLYLDDSYDLVHFFWRGKLLGFDYYDYTEYVYSLGLDPVEFRKEHFDNKIITTSVYDHLYLDDDIEFTKKLIANCDMYYVSSNKLKEIYDNLDLDKYPVDVITDGIDLDKFYPINLDRFNNIKDRKLVIGWVGNSSWESDKEDFKGVNTILNPVIDELIEEGYPIERYFADRQVRMIPHDKMVEYYSKIDLYVCTSKIEGTPNPVLESMACGIPIISTDVGIVKDAFGDIQKKYILEERSKECLKNKLIYLLNNLDELNKMKDENLIRIKDWTWDKISVKMDKFFERAFREIKK